jgi:Ulp1 family protease
LNELELSQELIDDLQAQVQEKLLLAPPPPPPEKPLIAPLTDDEKNKLEDAARKTDHGRNAAAAVVPDKLNARDFGTLLPDRFNGSAKAWLNDEIVNEYLSILVSHTKKAAGFEHKRGGPAPPVHAFASHFFTSASSPKGVKAVERWAGRVQLKGAQYLDADLILYPICDSSHWRLLAVKPKERVIEYLDSLGWDGQKYIDKIRAYLKQELEDLYIEDEWVEVEKQRSSKQLNGSDCGVFTLLNALVLLRGYDTKKVVSCHGMHDARERMAITLMAGHPTTEMD